MARKVFISFLGTSPYTATYYHVDSIENSTNEPLRFIQEASLLFHCSHFNENDKILIFVTNMANKANWLDNGHIDRDTKEILKSDGLKSRLAKTSMAGLVESFFIKDGNSTDEIWEIFSQVYEQIELNDEIYFDVTHAFRSIPMLFIVLINYAKLMKNITVAGIYYGAFEAKILKEKDLEGKDVFSSPIWDLKSFSELQDWTNASRDFIKYGNPKHLIELSSNKYKDFTKALYNLTSSIETNRGRRIYTGKIFKELNDSLSKLKNIQPKPLQHIIEAVKNKTTKFTPSKDWKNGLVAVEWCINHEMIQQGITILDELIVTYFCLNYMNKGNDDYKNSYKRGIVSKCIYVLAKNKPIEEWDIDLRKPENKETVEKLMSVLTLDIVSKHAELSALRNDINHSGYTNDKTEPDFFISKLKQLFDDFKTLLK